MQSNRSASSSSSASSLEPTAVITTSSPSPSSCDDRPALQLVVVDDEQVLDAALDEARDLRERVVEVLLLDRLLEERDGAGAERALPAVLDRR